VEHADEIEINEGIGKVDSAGYVKLKPIVEKYFKLIAKNKFGSEERSLNVVTFPSPMLETLLVPSPAFSSRVSFVKLRVASPKISTTINFQIPGKLEIPFTKPSIDLQSIKATYR